MSDKIDENTIVVLVWRVGLISINFFVKEMELFLEAGQNYAFLIELIVDYLKLDQRNKIKLVHLSQVVILLT